MKQFIQDLKSGGTTLEEVRAPRIGVRKMLIKHIENLYS